jgi:cytochrome P450
MTEKLDQHAVSAAPEYPMERTPSCPFAPPKPMLEMNETKPLTRVRIWNGTTPWLITGHEVARTLFADPRVSVDDRREGFPHWNEHMLSTVNKRPRSVFTSDAEEHTRFRRMLSKPFTFLRPVIQEVTNECIDEILAGPQPADMVAKLALPVPTRVISDMLGVPYDDHEFFQEHANAGLARYAAADAMQKGAMSLHQYLINLVEEKQANPSEDAVSDLAERVTAGEISVKEAAQLGTGLLIAGHETTANMIGIGILALLENPEQAALLRDSDDPKFIANAAEELMRYLSIIQNGQRRVATEDIEIGGETIKAGDGIIIDLAPANWDATAYPEPDKLDFTRDAGQQLGFGYGRHQCVGQQLARAELQIVFHTVLRRIPTMRLAIPLDEVPFKHDRLAYGVYELPVTW